MLNKIKDGGNLAVVVSPVYAAPALAVVDKSAQPTQNTFTVNTATTTTVKLYQVKGSSIQFKATAIGGSTCTDLKGVTITGDDSYNTVPTPSPSTTVPLLALSTL